MNRLESLNRTVVFLAFVLGLLCLGWVGMGFVGTSAIALVMTGVIGLFYLAGAIEIWRFRRVSASLAKALTQPPQAWAQLSDWLVHVPAPLQRGVRQRVEGERAGLPGLSLTPYLVGLLVMLGMLGTFLGMVVTFKGAVFALEGSADLSAIRSALAVPIKGLGLAFGTSVAGVATSAMLGLMATISRRERGALVRLLDERIANDLLPFSLAHRREQSFHALQQQASALPQVADQLQALMAKMERRSEQLDEQLLERQDRFHVEASTAYTELGQSVAQSLENTLSNSARVAGEALQPVVASAMAALAQEAERRHTQVSEAVGVQLQALSDQFAATTGTVTDTWTRALAQHERGGEQLLQGLGQSLTAFNTGFETQAAQLLSSVQSAQTQAQADRKQAEQEQQAALSTTLTGMAQTLQTAWQQAGEQSLAQQQAVLQALGNTATTVAERSSEQAGRSLEGVARLIAQTETLVQARAASEQAWTAEHGQRMDQLAALWRGELAALRREEAQRQEASAQRANDLTTGVAHQIGSLQSAVSQGLSALQEDAAQRMATLREADTTHQQALAAQQSQVFTTLAQQLAGLREDEALRGDAAVQRLSDLQAALAAQLATLGTALEAPMARLMETASEAPKAAAEVIAQLREQMSRLAERDNATLAERAGLVGQINSLLQQVQQTTGEQRTAIDNLVDSASSVLDRVGQQFADTVGAQAGRAEAMAEQAATSANQLASLGEAFQQGAGQLSASHEQLVQSLQRVEGAIGQSLTRSDEQLAYYVAQAREVIDLSISAQQGIVEDLRRLRGPVKAGAGAA